MNIKENKRKLEETIENVAVRRTKRNLHLQQKQAEVRFAHNQANNQDIVSTNASLQTNLVTVTHSTIPEYLHCSELYNTLQEGEHESGDYNEDILIPAKYYKTDETVDSQEDLVHLRKILY